MATKAYVLIETGVGMLREVTGRLQGLSGVETVDPVTGPYDIIAIVSATDLNAVGDLVTTEIHKIDGIVRTITCLSVGTT